MIPEKTLNSTGPFESVSDYNDASALSAPRLLIGFTRRAPNGHCRLGVPVAAEQSMARGTLV